ncbi:MAG TPA: DUF502 domain-containing protein [Sedimentisphaerales bacterium]|nr:DUF502 domain-containing protein [Sedimentisphaerales bacterium]HNU30439.1 DUF502 domain-containing protein [Sedimentisphaerales bacterium]
MQKGIGTIVGKSRIWVTSKKWLARRLGSGMLVLVPLGVTVLAVGWLFRLGAGLLRPVVTYALRQMEEQHWIQSLPEGQERSDFYVSFLAILLLLVLLYFIGGLGQHLIGRRLIAAWEAIWLRIPLARGVYSATKQVMEALSQPQGAAFKSVVIVDFPSPGLKAIGFLTGHVDDAAGRRYAKVLIPTAPNPTTGFLQLIPVEGVFVTSLTVEEGFKMLISGGIVSREDLLKPVSHPHPDLDPGDPKAFG